MRAAASLRCRVTETRAGVFVLCDLTNVLACFEKALSADRLSEMPDFVVDGTTAVLRDATHWDEVVTRLGYEHLRRHDLRHTGLTWMADAGVPVHVLPEDRRARIAGHHSALPPPRRPIHRGCRDRAERPPGS